MLPSSKRSAYHGRHQTSYHPYYSSSPVVNSNTTTTNNLSISACSQIKRNDHEEENYLEINHTEQLSNSSLTNTPNNKINLFGYSVSRSINASHNNSDQESSSDYVRTTPTGRPPTTPVSSTNCNNSLNMENSPQMVKAPDQSNGGILYVTPASSSISAASKSTENTTGN